MLYNVVLVSAIQHGESAVWIWMYPYVTDKDICVHLQRAKSLQSCPTLRDPVDCSPPGFSVSGIL